MKTDGTGNGKEFYFFENASLIQSLVNELSDDELHRKIASAFVYRWNWVCSADALGVQFHLPDFLKTYYKEEWEIVIRPKNKNSKKNKVITGQPAQKILAFLNTQEFRGYDISTLPKLKKAFKNEALLHLFEPLKSCGLVSEPSELDDFLTDLFLYTTNIDLPSRSFSMYCSDKSL